MSERRPHWDDYLLASVMIHCSDIYQCYAVIAAVEDWQASSAFSAIVDSEGDCRCGDSGVFLCPEHTRQEWLAWIVGGAS